MATITFETNLAAPSVRSKFFLRLSLNRNILEKDIGFKHGLTVQPVALNAALGVELDTVKDAVIRGCRLIDAPGLQKDWMD